MNTSGQFDQSEYLALIHLTKKLQVGQNQGSRSSIGGLSRIPEGDHEMQATSDTAMEVR